VPRKARANVKLVLPEVNSLAERKSAVDSNRVRPHRGERYFMRALDQVCKVVRTPTLGPEEALQHGYARDMVVVIMGDKDYVNPLLSCRPSESVEAVQ
jgi:hypothetical protein